MVKKKVVAERDQLLKLIIVILLLNGNFGVLCRFAV